MKVAEDLEAVARSLKKSGRMVRRATPSSHVALEIAVLSERLDELRDLHIRQDRDLAREECRIGNDLRRLRSYEPRVYWFSSEIRDNLKTRDLQVRRERARLQRDHASEVANVQDRLFKLLRQYATLQGGVL